MDSERKARYEQLYNIKLTDFYNFVSEVMGDFNYSLHRTVKDIENKRRIEIWAYQSREDQAAVVWIEVVKPGEILDPYITTDVLRTMNDENVLNGFQVFVQTLNSSSIDIRLIAYLKTGNLADARNMKSALLLKIVEKFREAGIDFAFPSTSVYMEN